MRDPLLDLETPREPVNHLARASLGLFGVGFLGIAVLLFLSLQPDTFRNLAIGLAVLFSLGWVLAMLSLRLKAERWMALSAGLAHLVFALALVRALGQL